MLEKIKSKIKPSFNNCFLILILGLASLLRFYRINQILGFWYDQGRDALVIWDFIHKGKAFLIGPMMGFTGMFRGAWYYWLITPFYYLGKGNPIWPNIFLILTSILAIFVLYKLGEGIGGKKTGILAIVIASVSYYIIGASRWLSDPTPTLLVSTLLVWALFKLVDKKKWALPLVALLTGLALQFSAATEIFYIPAILLILYFERKKLPNLKVFILSVMAFLVAFIPQGLFELRHPGVLSGALYQFIFHEKTFTFSFWQILKDRIPYDYNLFYSKFWINGGKLFAPFFVIFIALMIFGWKQFWKDDKFKIVFILSVAPFVGTLFFIGNLGAIYDYYFTGYYLIWILLFSIVFIRYSNRFLMKIVLFVFLIILFTENIYAFHINYSVPLTDQNTIAFTNQTDAISWIYKDAGRRQFNVDEYVPPVIPYTYNYLFTWFPTTPRLRGAAGTLVENQVPLLYTLYEVDPPHPERLQAWLDRQKGIGKVIKQATFGGITVQERERIIKK